MKMSTQLMKRAMKSSATAALTTLALALVPASLQAREITVPSGAIHTIQQGVDAAAPGDTVLVRPGTYVCNDVTEWWPPAVGIGRDKPGLKLKAVGPPGSVKLVGPGPGDGTQNRHGTGIRIEADNVCVEGFDISGFLKGIVASGSYVQGTQIARNTIHDCRESCIEVDAARNCEVAHNTLDGAGIFLNGENTQIHVHHNRVSGSQGDGIRADNSPGCELDNNECDNNDGSGIYLAGSPNCTADHNRADNNGFAGIDVGNSPNCAVTENEAQNNGWWGIQVGGSCGSSFERNVAEGNGQYDLFAPYWGSDPACNTYLKNRADTAFPSLALWDVKPSK